MPGHRLATTQQLGAARTAAGLGQQEAAAALGVSRWTLHREERGVRPMPEHRLAAYAALLAERGRRPSDAEAVRSAVTVRRDRLTMRQWDRRLRPAEREALRQLLREGVLVRVSELQTDAAGRPYVRKVVTV
ncbi:MAG: helix-turn-helix domain-containing protein, partial [Actinomycetota bacterium]|nr:helix-turn-helix domain-containing protein [Actinomycetota bacterium]